MQTPSQKKCRLRPTRRGFEGGWKRLPSPHAALGANPDVADKIRGGKVQAAGAIVGAVMKATKGQADARRVRELVMERVTR